MSALTVLVSITKFNRNRPEGQTHYLCQVQLRINNVETFQDRINHNPINKSFRCYLFCNYK